MGGILKDMDPGTVFLSKISKWVKPTSQGLLATTGLGPRDLDEIRGKGDGGDVVARGAVGSTQKLPQLFFRNVLVFFLFFLIGPY